MQKFKCILTQLRGYFLKTSQSLLVIGPFKSILKMEKTRALELLIKQNPLIEEITNSHENTIKWLTARGVFSSIQTCKKCGEIMRLWFNDDKPDGSVWGYSPCNYRRSIRTSILYKQHSKVPLTLCFFLSFFRQKF